MSRIQPHPEAFTLSRVKRPRIKDDGFRAFVKRLPSLITAAPNPDAAHIR